MHNSLYTLANNKLQLSSDLEDPNEANEWNSTNSHESELVIAYNTNAINNTLRPRLFYALYIGPHDDGNSHLIHNISIDQILVTMKYQSVPVPEDLIEVTNEIDASDNKIHVNHFYNNYFIVQDNHSNINNNNGCTHFSDAHNFEDESDNGLDSSQQLNGIESNKIFKQENQTLLTMESSKSTSVSVKHSGITSTSMSIQELFLEYQHEVVTAILYLQQSLQVPVHEYIIYHLYKGISMIVHLLLSLLVPLKSEILQSSLLMSLCKFLQFSLLVSLRSEIIRSYLLASLQDGII